MVSSVGGSWNTLYPSLLLMYEKLEGLGLLYIDGEAVYPEENSDV